MFRWAIIFAVIALIASLLGFGGVAGLSKDFAVILLVIAVILAIVGFLSRGKVYFHLRFHTKVTVENVYDIICRRYLQKKLNRHSYLATLNCKEHDSKAKK